MCSKFIKIFMFFVDISYFFYIIFFLGYLAWTMLARSIITSGRQHKPFFHFCLFLFGEKTVQKIVQKIIQTCGRVDIIIGLLAGSPVFFLEIKRRKVINSERGLFNLVFGWDGKVGLARETKKQRLLLGLKITSTKWMKIEFLDEGFSRMQVRAC